MSRSRIRDENDKSVYIIEERRQLRREAPLESFDRIAFAMRCLRILGPRMRVAVHESRWELKIERSGPAFDPGWAMVSIPRDATKEHIALVLAELTGQTAQPWMISTLVAQAQVA
jgi:hypothetical protein